MIVIPGMNAIAFTREVPKPSRRSEDVCESNTAILRGSPDGAMHRKARTSSDNGAAVTGDDALRQKGDARRS